MDPKDAIPQLLRRYKTDDWKTDYTPLVERGHDYGRQYAVWRSQQINPRYLVRFERTRLRPPSTSPSDGDGGGGSDGSGGGGSSGVGGGGGGGGGGSGDISGVGGMATANAPAAPRGKGKGKAPMTTAAESADGQRALFAIGLIADVQYADIDDGTNYDGSSKRHYRGALSALERAVPWWNAQQPPLACIAQLGDLIDGHNAALGQSHAAWERSLAVLRSAHCPLLNVVGNHELMNFSRAELAEKLGADRECGQGGKESYYAYSLGSGWRVLVLDAFQVSVLGWPHDDWRHQRATSTLVENNPNLDPNDPSAPGDWLRGLKGDQRRFVSYNGALGGEQLAWLGGELAAAANMGDRVIILSHAVLAPAACDGTTMVWDYEEALSIIDAKRIEGTVALVVCGHDHRGGYHLARSGVHHVTLCSPLNQEVSQAYGALTVFEDRLELSGPRLTHLLPIPTNASYTCRGGRTALDLKLRPRPAPMPLNAASGPSRVYLLRHGQSETNATGEEGIQDPLLTALGRDQATAWRGKLHLLRADCVLVSPMRRALQTALLAFDATDVPIEMCTEAREWCGGVVENQLSSLADVRATICQSERIRGLETAYGQGLSLGARSLKKTKGEMYGVLRSRLDDSVVVVVCHSGVIRALCGGEEADNCMLIECDRDRVSGALHVMQRLRAPRSGGLLLTGSGLLVVD